MGKFDGIWLCTDVDETLILPDRSLSAENIAAIQYFKENGGLFSLMTGRSPMGVSDVSDIVCPNAPMGCQNGAMIFDHQNQKVLDVVRLDKRYLDVLDFVLREFPFVSVEYVTPVDILCMRENQYSAYHRQIEHFSLEFRDVSEEKEPVIKLMFGMDENAVPGFLDQIRDFLRDKPFDIMRTHRLFTEMLSKGANKGTQLEQIKSWLGSRVRLTIAVGDNENDLGMIKKADIGYAVGNATPIVLSAADRVTVPNTQHAIAKIISDIENEL